LTDAEHARYPTEDPTTTVDWSEGGTVLAFVNEVAGGRRLLGGIRDRVEAGADSVAVAAPQNLPQIGQIVDRDEARDAALSRVEVTQAVLDEFGIESVGAVMDPDPLQAIDDAVRAFQPDEVLLSALYESRFGLLRKDLVEWAKSKLEVPVTHIPVRIDDDAVSWHVTHTLVVATRTISSPDLIGRLKARAAETPHRYTIICPRSGDISREQICDRLASALAELYRAEIDATGQPMSPKPFEAIVNAIDHYRIDDILISTLAGQQSKWLEEGLIDQVTSHTAIPVEHYEAGSDAPAEERDPSDAEEVPA
jgi:hypothetical protein